MINTFGIRVKVDEHGTDTLKSGFSFPFCALKFDGILMAKEDGFGTFICARWDAQLCLEHLHWLYREYFQSKIFLHKLLVLNIGIVYFMSDTFHYEMN